MRKYLSVKSLNNIKNKINKNEKVDKLLKNYFKTVLECFKGN